MTERGRGIRKHKSPLDYEETLAKVSKDLRLRLPQRVIARKHGLHHSTIGGYKKTLFKRYAEATINDRKEEIEEQVAFLEEIRLMVLKDYYRSLKPKWRTVKEWKPIIEDEEEKPSQKTKKGLKPKTKALKELEAKAAPIKETMQLLRVTRSKENRQSWELYNILLKTCEIECKIRGMFQDIKVENNIVAAVDWDELREPSDTDDPFNEIEAKLIKSTKSKTQEES